MTDHSTPQQSYVPSKPDWSNSEKARSFEAYVHWINSLARNSFQSDGDHPEMLFFIGEDGAVNAAQFGPGLETAKKNAAIIQGAQQFKPFGTIHVRIVDAKPINAAQEAMGDTRRSLWLTAESRLGKKINLVNPIESTPDRESLGDTMVVNEVGLANRETGPRNSERPNILWLTAPRPLSVDHFRRTVLGSIATTIIVNPFGPTISGFGIASTTHENERLLTRFSLNPFGQEVEGIGSFEADLPLHQLASAIIPRLSQFGFDSASCFTYLNLDSVIDDPQTLRQLARALVLRTEGVVRELSFLRKFPCDPWQRISAEIDAGFESTMRNQKRKTLLGRLRFGRADLDDRPPKSAEVDEYIDILLGREHRTEEVKAFYAAWKGSIEHNPSANAFPDLIPIETIVEIFVRLTGGELARGI